MIPNEKKEGWHYLTVKKTIHIVTSKHHDFLLLELPSFLKQKININPMKKYVKIGFLWNYNAIRKGYVRIQCQTSDKIPYIIYVETESLIKTIDGCANNPEILQQQK